MPSRDEVFRAVQTAIAETNGDDELVVEPSMRLMADVIDESINMLDLQFRLDRRFGIRIPGLTSFRDLSTDAEGRLTREGLTALRAVMPGSLLDRFAESAPLPTPKELWESMTVDDLVNLIADALAKKQAA
jgi:acyl carrier protein